MNTHGALLPVSKKALLLVAAFAGGWVADRVGVPLGWMLGSMFVVGMLSLAGHTLKVPSLIRWAVLAIIGAYMGVAFTPEVIHWLPRAVVSVIGMMLTVFIEVAIATFVMIKVMRCSFFTAYTACMPGGFSTMTLIAQEHGGDVETVSLVQLVRVIVVLCAVSMVARYYGVETTGAVSGGEFAIDTENLLLGMAVVLAGLGVGIFLKLPIFCMLSPMMIAAALQVSGLTEMTLPNGPLAVALVVLGAAVGSHWHSFRSGKFVKCLLFGLFLGAFLLLVSAAAAILVSRTVFLDIAPTLLAYSPGGVSEISLIAVALDIEPALVGLHHVLRVLFIFFTLPIVLHVAHKRINPAGQR